MTIVRTPAHAARSVGASDTAAVATGGRWRAAWATWHHPLLVATGCVLVLRTITTVVALVSAYGINFPHVVAHHPGDLVNVWAHWDTGYYVTIALHGYPALAAAHGHAAVLPREIAFGPAFPTTMQVFQVITGSSLVLAGQVVSALAAIAALMGVVHLATSDTDRPTAGTSVMLLVAFPSAFFLVADYADSLALAFVVWALVAARHRRWAIAGCLAVGAFFSKYYLLLVVAALLVEVWEASATTRSGVRGDWRRWLPSLYRIAAVSLPAVAALASWMAVCDAKYRDALAFVHVQAEWGRHFAFPWSLAGTTASDLVHLRFLDTSTASVMELFDAVTVVALLALAVYCFFRVRRSYGVLLFLAFATFTFQTMLYSETREVLALFPFFIGLARWTQGHPWRERLLLGLFLPSSYYLVWRFVTGRFAG